MEWKLLASTFGLVFLAELGDKTQLATLSLAASGRSRPRSSTVAASRPARRWPWPTTTTSSSSKRFVVCSVGE